MGQEQHEHDRGKDERKQAYSARVRFEDGETNLLKNVCEKCWMARRASSSLRTSMSAPQSDSLIKIAAIISNVYSTCPAVRPAAYLTPALRYTSMGLRSDWSTLLVDER